MKLRFAMPVLASFAFLAGCASDGSSGGGTADTKGKPGAYDIKGTQVEACECDSVCPCIFNKEASYDQCQGWIGLSIKEGSYEGTDLSGISCAAALLHTGKDLGKTMGKWEGAVWISDGATEAQKKGVTEIIKKELGGAFAKLDFKTAKITWAGSGEHWEMAVGGVGEMKITAIKGADGKVLCVHNSPSPIVMPEYNCCLADSDTFSDGGIKWDYKGRNGGYGPFEMKSK
jgi:hypothetical protein